MVICAARALRLVTIAAIHRPVFSWLERHLSLIPTTCTGSRVHLAWLAVAEIATAAAAIIIRLPFTCSTARWTTAGSIYEPAALIKFLLACCENKFLIAIATIQVLIGECHVSFSIPGCLTQLSCIVRLTREDLL